MLKYCNWLKFYSHLNCQTNLCWILYNDNIVSSSSTYIDMLDFHLEIKFVMFYTRLLTKNFKCFCTVSTNSKCKFFQPCCLKPRRCHHNIRNANAVEINGQCKKKMKTVPSTGNCFLLHDCSIGINDSKRFICMLFFKRIASFNCFSWNT